MLVLGICKYLSMQSEMWNTHIHTHTHTTFVMQLSLNFLDISFIGDQSQCLAF